MSREELRAAVEASRPPGYFDDVAALLDHFLDLRGALDDLWVQLRQTPVGSEASLELTIEVSEKMAALAEVMQALHLGAGNRDLPPPRLQ